MGSLGYQTSKLLMLTPQWPPLLGPHPRSLQPATAATPLGTASGPRVLSVPGSLTLRARASGSRPAGEGASYPHVPEEELGSLPRLQNEKDEERGVLMQSQVAYLYEPKWVASADSQIRGKSRFLGFLEKPEGGPHGTTPWSCHPGWTGPHPMHRQLAPRTCPGASESALVTVA